MLHSFSRLELGIGHDALQKLKKSTVVILGIGGVGSYTAEALARSGVGRLVIVDKDSVDITNINRQIHALHSTIGQVKVDLMEERIKAINPQCEVVTLHMFFNKDTLESVLSYQADYIVDAIDTMENKILAIVEAKERGIPIISSMGAANKLDPTQLMVTDISKTYMDPVAKIIRQKLKKVGIEKGVKVVFSPEKPLVPKNELYTTVGKQESEVRKERIPPSSNAFVPPVAGMILASVVVKDLIKWDTAINGG